MASLTENLDDPNSVWLDVDGYIFLGALEEVENKNFDKAVQMLDLIINQIPQPLEEKHKPKLIRILRHRCDANFRAESYQDVAGRTLRRLDTIVNGRLRQQNHVFVHSLWTNLKHSISVILNLNPSGTLIVC
ncbi:unnamed protein product [Rotaria socialis]